MFIHIVRFFRHIIIHSSKSMITMLEIMADPGGVRWMSLDPLVDLFFLQPTVSSRLGLRKSGIVYSPPEQPDNPDPIILKRMLTEISTFPQLSKWQKNCLLQLKLKQERLPEVSHMNRSLLFQIK